MNIKSITFNFENCDSLKIDGNFIGDLYAGGANREITKIAVNSFRKIDTINTFFVAINKAANQDRYPFNDKNLSRQKETVFKRLSYGDIVSVDFKLVAADRSPEHYSYCVKWKSNNDCINSYQKTFISNIGDMYLIVSDDAKITDFYSTEEMEDKNLRKIMFGLYM